jgi:hypothetical protein
VPPNVIQNLGCVGSAQPTKKRLRPTAKVINMRRKRRFFDGPQAQFPMLSTTAAVDELSFSLAVSGTKTFAAEYVGFITGRMGSFKKPDFRTVKLCLLFRGNCGKGPISLVPIWLFACCHN